MTSTLWLKSTYVEHTEDNQKSRLRNGLALAAMAMLSTRNWVRVPLMISGVFNLLQGFSTQ